MTDLVPIRKGNLREISLADLQDRLDARKEIAEARSGSSTLKSRVEEARRAFSIDPLSTLVEIQTRAKALADVFDADITMESIPLSQEQINKLSAEWLEYERLMLELKALEGRYRDLVFGHLDATVKKVVGRPVSQMPGKVKSTGPGPRIDFERRGGNRANPTVDAEGLRGELPPEVVAQVYVVKHHPAVPAWDEEVFDEVVFSRLVDEGLIDLDVVAKYLTAGEWRTPSLHKNLVGDR